MNKVLLSVALALGLCGSGCFSQSTDKNDIRFVDVDRILTQSKTARVRDSHIEAVNQSLKADLEKLMQAMAALRKPSAAAPIRWAFPSWTGFSRRKRRPRKKSCATAYARP